MKKTNKIIVGLTAIILISILLFLANGLFGNPVSKALAEQNVPKYIEETYPNLDLEVERVDYSFKTGRYFAVVKSPTSVDTHFDVYISLTGKILSDSYESDVLSGWNTCQRIDSEYRTMTDKVFQASKFPYISYIKFGSFKIIETDIEVESIIPAYGLVVEDLELDKKYDIKELAKSAGHITFYTQSEEITIEQASEILLDLKKIFDKVNVPFYAIDFVLEKPRNDDGTPNEDRTELSVNDFLYNDIYKEGMEERFSRAVKVLEEYYKKEDAIRTRE